MVVDVGILQCLLWIIGDGMMCELVYIGCMVDGEEVWSIGLVNCIYVDQVVLMDGVFELVWQIVVKLLIVICGIKEMICYMCDYWVDDGFEYVVIWNVVMFQFVDLWVVMVVYMVKQKLEFVD